MDMRQLPAIFVFGERFDNSRSADATGAFNQQRSAAVGRVSPFDQFIVGFSPKRPES
jgi:hypothetical protein